MPNRERGQFDKPSISPRRDGALRQRASRPLLIPSEHRLDSPAARRRRRGQPGGPAIPGMPLGGFSQKSAVRAAEHAEKDPGASVGVSRQASRRRVLPKTRWAASPSSGGSTPERARVRSGSREPTRVLSISRERARSAREFERAGAGAREFTRALKIPGRLLRHY